MRTAIIASIILAQAFYSFGFLTNPVGLSQAKNFGINQPNLVTFQSRIQATNDVVSANSEASIATLDEKTRWKMRVVLNDMRTAQGKKVDETFIANIRFSETEGYEPPQGTCAQVEKGTIDISESSDIERLKVTNGRWKLSEDPDDRKDGLWIWGLFKEPLYPFLLFQFDMDMVDLPGEDGDFIKATSLFAMINHKRKDGEGVVLNSPTVLTTRVYKDMKADLLGVAKVEVYDEFQVGQLYFTPV
mmetsp:Transcript_40919/g.80065  ORF Transcript_40919/g.80065 Transcript_40919/m.80065 type:complete len:245 (+) Transcript_40919:235-969(+)